MIKHLIEFEGKKIALDKRELIALAQAIEPYAIGIMMGIPDENIGEFAAEHRNGVKDMMKAKSQSTPSIPKPEATAQPNHEADIVSLNTFRHKKRANADE